MKLAVGCLVGVLTLLSLAVSPALAQATARRLTTIDALRRFPGYYHLQNILLRGEFTETNGRVQFRADERSLDVVLADGIHTTSGPVEIRAQLVDVGRLDPGDPRVASYSGAGVRDNQPWPKPGEELLLNVTAVSSTPSPGPLTVHGLALEPWRYDGQTVTLVGQFRGRNLFGDLPGAPAKSKYDFVLRNADGAVWITGLRPKGKGFDLDVDARVDTNQWLEVTGVVRRERSLVTLEATKLAVATPQTERVVEDTPPPPPPSPVEVVFSSPTAGETDVPTGSIVRVQFSKGLDPASIAAGFTARYADGSASTAMAFKTTYDLATRSVEIHFLQPMTPLRTVTVETREGLKGFDGAPVSAWTLTFTAGG